MIEGRGFRVEGLGFRVIVTKRKLYDDRGLVLAIFTLPTWRAPY